MTTDTNIADTAVVDAGDLQGRSFAFGRADGSSIGVLTLRPDGTFAGHRDSNETYWLVERGMLLFCDTDGRVTTAFDRVVRDGATYRFSGAFLAAGATIRHTLNEIAEFRAKRPIESLLLELYGGDSPLAHADPSMVDDGYPHTNLMPDVVRSIVATFRPAFWLEIGCMVGGSAVRVAEIVKAEGTATDIVCIDPFCGDVNMWAWEQPKKHAGEWQFLRLAKGRPTIYDRFLANVAAAGHADVILPIAATSIVGLKLLRRLVEEQRLDALPDVIYLDSAHEPGETFLELQNCWSLLAPGGVLMGDDWDWAAVRNDVLRFAATVSFGGAGARLLAEHHGCFTRQGGVLLDRGQWVMVK